MSDYVPVSVRFEGRAAHYGEVLGPEATLAASLVEQWGMVVAIPDGQDDAGRSKHRLAEPAEVVERAFALAVGIYAEARRRGLTAQVQAPPPGDNGALAAALARLDRLDAEAP